MEVFDVEIVRIDAEFDVRSFEPLLEAAATLGARALLVAGDDEELSRLTANYVALAATASPFGLVASLEFMPWTAVPHARAAAGIVSQADGPARSVLIDTLHAARSATTLDDLRNIPSDWIHYIQLCDATTPAPTNDEDLIRDAREHRLAPGEGGLDLADLLSTVPLGTPISVELPNETQRRRVGTERWLTRLASTARAVEREANEISRHIQ